jgi:glycosidase
MSVAFPVVSWANGSNIYEVNIRQYTPEGTINAFVKHLPRLKDMGVEILWLMPVTPISIAQRQGSWGSYYAASSYVDVDPLYGTTNDFENFVTKAHEMGMKVIIDWVANHTGYDHQWTTKFPEFYHKDEGGNFTGLHGWIDVIDLNYTIPAMRAEMIASMKHWIHKFDIDGFRCDMARTVPLDFWLEARAECDTMKSLLWLAECEVFDYHEVFDITYGWEAMRALDKYFATGKVTLEQVKDILKNYAQYPAGALKLLFTSNHDENTYYGTEYEKYGSAAGAVAVFTCTWPGVPLIYSGQELPNKKRLSFFEKDQIEWTGNIALHDFYQKFLNLRLENKALQSGASVLILKTNNLDILAYLCRKDDDKILVMVNFGKEKTDFEFDHPAASGKYVDLFKNEKCSLERKQSYSFDAGEYKVYYVVPG